MGLQLRERIGPTRPRWFTTAFWVIVFVSVYWLTFTADWELWLLPASFGGTVLYCWWRVRRPQRWGRLWAHACGLIAVAALSAAGWALLTPFYVPTESVGSNRVECGSIISPIPGEELREVRGTSAELVARDRPIPQENLERVCARNAHYRTSNAVGAIVIGLLMSARSAGHFFRGRPHA